MTRPGAETIEIEPVHLFNLKDYRPLFTARQQAFFGDSVPGGGHLPFGARCGGEPAGAVWGGPDRNPAVFVPLVRAGAFPAARRRAAAAGNGVRRRVGGGISRGVCAVPPPEPRGKRVAVSAGKVPRPVRPAGNGVPAGIARRSGARTARAHPLRALAAAAAGGGAGRSRRRGARGDGGTGAAFPQRGGTAFADGPGGVTEVSARRGFPRSLRGTFGTAAVRAGLCGARLRAAGRMDFRRAGRRRTACAARLRGAGVSRRRGDGAAGGGGLRMDAANRRRGPLGGEILEPGVSAGLPAVRRAFENQ